MTVADEAAGWAEAQRRIEACRETRAEELDLGGLRLTRVPEEVYELRWLRRLYLGAGAEARRLESDHLGMKGRNALGTLPGAVCKALARLELLDLENNWLRSLPAEFADLANLKSLNLGRNSIGDAGARTLTGLVNLASLDLTSNEIGDAGAKALASLVHLTSLNLQRNKIGADGACELTTLLNLTSLNLDGNHVGADGAQALSALVNLTTLHLYDNGIDDTGAQALASL